MARLLVRERHDVVTQRPGGDVYIAELAGGDGGVVPFDSEPTGFETAGEVAEGTCVNQLSNDRSTSPSITANDMNETKTISTKTRDIRVLDEVLSLEFSFVGFIPVPSYR